MSARSASRRLEPLALLTAAIVASIVLHLAMGARVHDAYRETATRVPEAVALEQLRGRILLLDEVLTMSARAAAATGEPRWERRYHDNEPLLAAAIAEAEALAARDPAAIAQTQAANAALVALELRAFEEVRAGRREAALGLLFSADYEGHKARYAAGMEQLEAALGREVEAAAGRARSRLRIAGVAVAGTVAVLTLGLLSSLRVVREHIRQRRRAERAYQRANEELEARVRARSVELEQANASLRDEIAARGRLEKQSHRAVQREQERIGQELHDGLAHEILGAALDCKVLQRGLGPGQERAKEALQRVVDRLNAATRSARDLARGLHDSQLRPGELVGALEELCDRTGRHASPTCVLRVEGELPPLSAGVETQLFLIAREAIANAVQHSGAGRIEVGLEHAAPELVLTVTDDGRGLPQKHDGSGLGLRLIHHRATTLGALVTLEPSPAGGLRLRCSLDLEADALGSSASALPAAQEPAAAHSARLTRNATSP